MNWERLVIGMLAVWNIYLTVCGHVDNIQIRKLWEVIQFARSHKEWRQFLGDPNRNRE